MATLDTSFFGIYEEIILTKNGVWLSNGEEITHPGTLLAFSKNIFRNKNGFEIRLGTGDRQEKKTIHVEDTFYFVKTIEGNPEEGFILRLTDGRTLPLDPSTLAYRPGRLTCRVHHPGETTTEEAKFLSPAYYELLHYLQATEQGFTITIQGKTINLGNE